MRILFVDDCLDDVLLAGDVLRRSGFTFEERVVSTFAETGEAFGNGGWSLVVSDYNLGSHTGLDVLRLVRERDPDVPFILLSGTIGEERAAEAIREGAGDYVMKDRMGRLPASVRRELETARARRDGRALHARLRSIEERYRRTIERAPIGIVNSDASGRFISVNARFCELLGYEEHEVLGRLFSDFGHPEDNALAVAGFNAVVNAEHATAQYDRRYVRKDGRVVWGRISLAPVNDANGTFEYVIGLVEDITAQKNAEEKLRLQTRLLECVEQAVVATDRQRRITYWNAFAETMYGWREEEVLGRSMLDLTEPIGTSSNEERQTVVEQGESWSGEVMKQRRDGTLFPAMVLLSPLYDEQGVLFGGVGVSHDLTANKRAETELRESRRQLAEAQDIARISSWTWDFRTGERTWSDAFFRLGGFDPDRVPTLSDVLARVHPEDRDRVVALFRSVQKGREEGSTEFRALTPAGKRIIHVRYSFTHDADGRPLQAIGVLQDVTEAKQLEAELRHRSVQQSAVANLGKVALSGASIPFLIEQAIDSVREVLSLGSAAVVEKNGDASSATECAVRAPIQFSDGTVWGYLEGHAAQARVYASHDLDFLRSMANIIGQALERRETEAVLARRARQQSALAQLGSRLLTSFDQEVFAETCDALQFGTGAEYSFFAELTSPQILRFRAGHTWAELPQELFIDRSSQAGTAVLLGQPIVVGDYRTERRFSTFDITVPHGVLSGAIVPVASGERVFGVLSAQSRSAEHFGQEELDFMQTIANTLAEAMEREFTHRMLQASEEHFRRIFDGASEIIFSVDTEGRYTSLNPAFETITGWKRDEWLGKPFLSLVTQEEGARLTSILGEIVETQQALTETTATLRGRDRDRIIDITVFPKVEDGKVVEVYGFGRDVTDARRATEERERLTRNLELLLESTVEGIYTVDIEGRCTMVNRSAAAFLGVDREEVLGRSIHELLHRDADGNVLPLDTCGVHGVLLSGETHTALSDRFCRKDGVLIPVAYSAAPILDGGVRIGAVVTFTDLTEKQKLEAKLEQVTRLSSLGRLAATVAHEFNNVLMGIGPFVEILRRTDSPQQMSNALDHIATSVKRGGRITEEILRFTQPSQPVRTTVEVAPWLDSVAVEARSLVGPRHKILVDAHPLRIDADPNQLHQIFINLILNARDAMPSGGTITISARREAADARFPFGVIDDPSRFVHLAAADTGFGMSQETLLFAFEPLFTTKRNGTGLGLAVAHQVVQRHGGEIFVESTPGEGTTFHLFLPLSETQSLPVSEPEEEAPHEAADARRILVVEDDPVVAAGLRAILEYEEYIVTAVDNGRAALEIIRQNPPDAVVLDVGLPDMDGTAVFSNIAEVVPRLPVLFSTGHADRGRLEEFLSMPNVGYLLKPYEGQELMKALDDVMSN